MAPIQVKIFYANAMVKPFQLEVDGSMTVGELRTRLSSELKAAGGIEAPPALLRVICMGRPFQQDSTKLEVLPQFDYPTPLHVSLRPAGVEGAAESSTAQPTKPRAAATTGSTATASTSCCIIM